MTPGKAPRRAEGLRKSSSSVDVLGGVPSEHHPGRDDCADQTQGGGADEKHHGVGREDETSACRSRPSLAPVAGAEVAGRSQRGICGDASGVVNDLRSLRRRPRISARA